jgi:hypothetical protein
MTLAYLPDNSLRVRPRPVGDIARGEPALNIRAGSRIAP